MTTPESILGKERLQPVNRWHRSFPAPDAALRAKESEDA